MSIYHESVLKSVLMLSIIAACGASQGASEDGQLVSQPKILPKPTFVQSTSHPLISLNGVWQVVVHPPEGILEGEPNDGQWRDVPVPAELAFHLEMPSRRGRETTGLSDPPDYIYRRSVQIPADFRNKKIFLRFAGVTGDAACRVNDIEVARHHGGFTVWNPEITSHVTPGTSTVITVMVWEPRPNQSTNGYTGGIIRNVELMALPEDHIEKIHIETDLDDACENAVLKIHLGAALGNDAAVGVRFTLQDPQGHNVRIEPTDVALSRASPKAVVSIPVEQVQTWDAEHPRLYHLKCELRIGETTIEIIEQHVGFREIKIDGRRLLVNGKEVKLRGSGQFDSDPLDGISLDADEAERDVRLYKGCNHNFVRPACYPASEDFLAACDRIGLYVEGEMPVTFAAEAANDPTLTHLFLSQAAETVEQCRNHPSIIMWDLANETGYGVNIRKMSEYVHAADKTRPVVFSWSHTVDPKDPLPYEIYSYHYPPYDANLGEAGVAVFNGGQLNRDIPPMPVLCDEFAHPASYNYEEMRRDPNVRNFWGESVKIFWERMFETEGCLGGAIWAGIDHPMNRVNVYPWGLLDKWRRPKPEYWLTKKAYSPVRISAGQLPDVQSDGSITLPVGNWFDHTNLNETRFHWRMGSQKGEMVGPDVPPHGSGHLRIPVSPTEPQEVLQLTAYDSNGLSIDEYRFAMAPLTDNDSVPAGPPPTIVNSPADVEVRGSNFSVTFSKQTGLITSAKAGGELLIHDGPRLHIGGVSLDSWQLKNFESLVVDNEAVVRIRGQYAAKPDTLAENRRRDGANSPNAPQTAAQQIDVCFELHVDGQGLLSAWYELTRGRLASPPTQLVPWNVTSAGGYEEVGLKFLLTEEIDRLAWSRKGLWSVYPDDHIGRTLGTAPRRTGRRTKSDIRPHWPWSQDEQDFNLFGANDIGGRGTNDFRAMKENIYFAEALDASNHGVRVESQANHAVRLEVANERDDAKVFLVVNNEWNYRNLGLGNYMKPPINIAPGYKNKIQMRLLSTPKQHTGGELSEKS